MQPIIAFVIPYMSIVLPGTLLLLQWLLKLSVDNSISRVGFTESVLLLPIDIAFLSLSFIAAFTLLAAERSLTEMVQVGLISIVVCVILGIITIITSKRSWRFFELDKNTPTIVSCLVSYIIALFMIVYSVSLFGEPL